MDTNDIGNILNRSVKLLMDSGEAATPEEAEKIFKGYHLRVDVGRNIAQSPTLQAALLTIVNAGRRCFLGGVEVIGCPDSALRVPWRGCHTIADAIVDLQGSLKRNGDHDVPRIVLGDVSNSAGDSSFAVRATFDGWCGGVVPLDDSLRLSERREFTPAGVFAGALAVSEAFQFVRGGNALAGRRKVGLSLWRPDAIEPWFEDRDFGPEVGWLPNKLWLIGLGHLGQAYLWTLGFLPYDNPSEVRLVLQDFDTLVWANDSTSLLTDRNLIGRKKTRAMAAWCEERRFETQILERRFASDFLVNSEEPLVALCGVNNELTRAALEDVGFSQIIEAGLGLGTEEYLAFQVHCFPATRPAHARWGTSSLDRKVDSVINQPAYQSLAAGGLDQCGLTMLAGRSVGAAFVGAATSALVVAELLRMCMGEQRYEVIDGTLRSLDYCNSVVSELLDSPFNPGLTRAVAPLEFVDVF